MIKYLKQYRFYITLFFFILIPLMAIDTTYRQPRDFRFYDRVVIGMTAPIQITLSWTLEKIALGFERYIYLWHTHQENLELLEENRRLLKSIADFREIQQENLRLRKLLRFEEKLNFKSILARVISKDISNEYRSLRLNRGEEAGVKRNMAVITDEGVVGRILRTSWETSDVLTLLDPLSAVDTIVERSRARGVVEGLSDDICQLKFALRTDDIEPGDLLISSGLGGIFPKGLSTGIVSRVNRKSYGITQEVEVRPSADFSKLEEVLIVFEDLKPEETKTSLQSPPPPSGSSPFTPQSSTAPQAASPKKDPAKK